MPERREIGARKLCNFERRANEGGWGEIRSAVGGQGGGSEGRREIKREDAVHALAAGKRPCWSC